jgi:hypothetical protein
VTAPHRPRVAGRRWPWAALLVVIAALLVVAVLVRPGTTAGPSTLAPEPVMSAIELAGTQSLGRDCGYSAPLPADPASSLWLFCDTPVYVRRGSSGWGLQRFIAGSTAAVAATVAGPGPSSKKPGTLSEIRTPRAVSPAAAGDAVPAGGSAAAGAGPASRTPAQFLPTPAELFTSAGLPCGLGNGSYAVSWISGVARVPSAPYLLISFNDYCVLGSSGGFLPEGFGLAEYDPAAGTLSTDVTVFSGTDGSGIGAAPVPLGSPVFSGGYLYLFGATCSAPAQGRCAGTLLEARVAASPGAWADPLAYQWWSASPTGQWTSDEAAAAALIPGPRPAGLSVAEFPAAGRRLVLVEQTGIGGSFTVYQSPALPGTWSTVRSGQVACQVGSGFANFCRALIAHPELSTPAQLVLSYFDPADGPDGHVMVEGFTW